MNSNNSNRNKLVVPGAQNAIDQMKYEIANEFGVNLGPDATSRANGSVGGEITKRLVEMGQNQIAGRQSPVSYTHLDVYKRQESWSLLKK